MDTLEQMIESLQLVGIDSAVDNKRVLKMSYDIFKSIVVSTGKENGENLLESVVDEIVTDSGLLHDNEITIEDFAKYLMSK